VTVNGERQQIISELREADRFLLTTHENPDGDALGSLLAMHEILRLMGKDSLMFMAADQFPPPVEYQHMPFEGVRNEPPADIEQRTVVFLDCGNIDRMPVDFLQKDGMHILNIDHHHDNTRFGTVNLVEPDASCTAEILYGLAKDMDVEITLPIADALYVALVTDTGKFMFENTTPAAHMMAADLLAIGVSAQEVHRHLYEGLPFSRVELLGRALGNLQRYEDAGITLTHLTREDFAAAGASEADSEGIVDHLRAVEGTAVAALVRELLDDPARRKVSLRSTDGRVDVSRIARGLGGGGHRQAAGFTTDMPMPELVDRIRDEVCAQLQAVG
jgi:bifunctional oligoribonuclease and PAP phosphatase NrnA